MLKALGKLVLGPNLIFGARAEIEQVRTKGVRGAVRWNANLLRAWAGDRRARRRYRVLSEEAARATRRSDTVFVFGSGASLNELTRDEWDAFAQHDTFGFNEFFRQRWVRVDYHLLRAGVYGVTSAQPYVEDVLVPHLRDNPRYADTVWLMPRGLLADFPNYVVAHGYLGEGSRLVRYPVLRAPGPPARRLADGVRHAGGTLVQAVNCAYCLGWRRIVLVGIDLYDSRYFWLPPDRTIAIDHERATITSARRNNVRGNRFDERHLTARPVIDVLASWREQFAASGVELNVYNPRSLLTEILPVYEREPAAVP